MRLETDQTRALTELAHSQGWLAPGAAIERLTTAGEGNMNRVLRAEISDGARLVFKQSLPFVARYPDIPAPVERLDSEYAFYQATAPVSAVSMRMPRVLGYAQDHRIMCMEDLGDGADMTRLYAQSDLPNEGPLKAITALVYWLGKLHALPMSDADRDRFANLDMRALNHAHIFEIPFMPDNGVTLSAAVRQAAADICDSDLVAAAAELGEVYLGRAPHASRPCLLHGDFYPGSWMAHPAMGVMVIDPEFSFVGPPEFDLGVMAAHLTFTGASQVDLMRQMQGYVLPGGFEFSLAMRFAGVEMLRRLLGVAQLPLTANDDTRVAWLHAARALLVPA